MYQIDDFKMLEPMKYYDNPEPTTVGAKQKRMDMLENKNHLYIASRKNDGDWSMLIHTSQDDNLIRSRSISKVTGVYGDYTLKVPHIVEEMNKLPDKTVLVAELCWDKGGTNANTVGTILRCLPEKAVQRQKDEKLKAVVFDILMYDGEDISMLPYEKRLQILSENLSKFNLTYVYPTEIFEDNFIENADRIISAGGEGLVIQKRTNPYMPGTRTAWATLKMKQSLPHMDLKVIGTIEPNKLYDGINKDNWIYWEGVYNDTGETVKINHAPNNIDAEAAITWIPVTKPYYMNWKNGIIVDFEGVEVSVTSGLTDEDREWLATTEAAKMIEAGELYAEIKAMSVNDKGSLRHGSLVRLRNDM